MNLSNECNAIACLISGGWIQRANKNQHVRDQIVTMQPSATVSHQIVHCRSPEEQFHSFSTKGEEELYKLVKSAKPTTWMLFDSNLSFDSHVSSICKTAFFYLKNISNLRPMLSMSNAEMLIHAFMTSRLDYGCGRQILFLFSAQTLKQSTKQCSGGRHSYRFKSRLKTHLFNLAFTQHTNTLLIFKSFKGLLGCIN